MHYIDTSVLAAFYLPEAGSAKAQKFYAGLSEAAVSTLTEVEFHSAIARRVRMNDLSRDNALKAISQFKVHIEDRLYRMAAVEQRDYMLARDWLATFYTPLRTLDALHLAVAFSNDFRLVTADKVLARSAKHFGVKHKLIS